VPGWVEHAVWWHLYPLGFTGAPIRPAEVPGGDGPAGEVPGGDGAAAHGAAGHEAVVHRLRRVEDWLGYAVDLGVSGLALGPVFAAETHGYDTVDHFRIDPRLGDDTDFDRLAGAAHERGLRILLDGVFNHVGRGFPGFAAVLEQGPAAATASWFELSWPEGAGPGTEPGYRAFEGHPSLVALNHGEPAVADYVARVMTHWLARGADGWRLDAAYAIPPAFWASVLPRVRAAHPGAYLVGEVIHGDYPRIVAESGMDAVTQYELWKAIWSSLNDGNFFELAWALDRHNEFLDTFAPYTFVGNHDVTRLASQLVTEAHLPLALAILLSVGGTPAIYAGDEQAFRGVKEDRPGGDDAVRPEFPATPAALAPHGWPTYRLHQDLIGLRRRHPWLHEARTSRLHLASTAFAYIAHNGPHQLITALNAGDAPAELPVAGATAVLAGTGDLGRPGTPDAVIGLPGHSWAILAA
jgi:cyclomaltodextrinase / maltogenic alpha-amylase / neopullulanase